MLLGGHDPPATTTSYLDRALESLPPTLEDADEGTFEALSRDAQLDADPFEMLERVNSKTSFIAFVEALAADRRAEVAAEAASPTSPYDRGARGWEHGSIEEFLEAMASWAPSTSAETGQLQVPEEPSWRAFADILYAGKIYE